MLGSMLEIAVFKPSTSKSGGTVTVKTTDSPSMRQQSNVYMGYAKPDDPEVISRSGGVAEGHLREGAVPASPGRFFSFFFT
jgi:hypothetical protein